MHTSVGPHARRAALVVLGVGAVADEALPEVVRVRHQVAARARRGRQRQLHADLLQRRGVGQPLDEPVKQVGDVVKCQGTGTPKHRHVFFVFGVGYTHRMPSMSRSTSSWSLR